MEDLSEHAAPTKKWAIIDQGGVLRAFDIGEHRPGSIGVPIDCDLEIGKYRWDGSVWQPIMSEFKRTRPPADPDNLIAIALGFRALRDQGLQLPPYTEGWLETFERWSDGLPFDHDVTKAVAQWNEIDKQRKAKGS